MAAVYPAGPEPTITNSRKLIAPLSVLSVLSLLSLLSLLKTTLILFWNIPIARKIPIFALSA